MTERTDPGIEQVLDEDSPKFIWVCQNPACDLNPFKSTVAVCDRCLGSNCSLMVGEDLQPIDPNSDVGRDLCNAMGL